MEYNKETKTLTIYYNFNEELKDIPNDTQIIIFRDSYKFDKLPKCFIGLLQNLTHLTLNFYFNQNYKNLPQSLTYLKFGYNFNQKINNLTKYFLGFPKNLYHLTFGIDFNQKVNDLPKNLTHLIFGHLKNYIHNFWMHQPNGRLVL